MTIGSGDLNQIRDAARDVARDATTKVGGAIESVRELDLVGKATDYVTSNPTPALLGALALGFVAGLLIRRS